MGIDPFRIKIIFIYKGKIFIYFKAIISKPILQMSFIFILLFGFVVGFTSFNFGALARYKIPSMPIFAAFAGVAWFAALGLPGFSGFIAEALVFLGAFPKFQTLTIIAVLSVVLTAAYMLWSYQRIFFGPVKEDMAAKYHYHTFKDLSFREILVLAPLTVTAVVVGFYPKVVLSLMDTSLVSLVEYVKNASGM